MKNGHLDILNGNSKFLFFFVGEGGILHILKTLLPHFRRKTIIMYLFIASYISVVMVYYMWMSVTSNLHSKFLFLFYFATFFYFLPHFLAKNSKYKMLSTHILKSTILSCNSTHQTALNKECPQSSQFRNWSAH